MPWDYLAQPHDEGFAPLYAQVAQRLRLIAAGLDPGDLMPSETEIMSLSGVGRVTARRALAELAQEGLVYGVRGKGTFVARPRVPTQLGRPLGFTEAMQRRGREPSTRVLKAEEVVASAQIARTLQVKEGAPVFMIERLRFIDDVPAMLERTHLDASAMPGLLQHPLHGSLYSLLKAEYGLSPNRGTEVVLALSADRQLAQALTIAPGAPILATYRSTETESGQSLEFSLRYARGDLCSFEVALSDTSDLVDQSIDAKSLLASP
jgi:GntR family transcriptional regulator